MRNTEFLSADDWDAAHASACFLGLTLAQLCNVLHDRYRPQRKCRSLMENHVASSTEELLSIARSGFGEIGYQEELLLPRYQFADFFSPSYPVREIQLAGFAQQPPSYRTASFGVLIAPDAHERIADFTALGAPHVFVINPDTGEVDRWVFQVSKSPRRVEQISSDALGT